MTSDFDAQVRRHVERLNRHSFQEIEAAVARKRISWFKRNQRNHQATAAHKRLSPREGYEFLFHEYMGLSQVELPVVSETESEVVWLSRNRCPTLDACHELGMDTRVVCRAVYEKSTQALLSQLDPQLRFLRSYDEIRPDSGHCKEMIARVDFNEMMEIAIEQAKASKRAGDKGYGAVVALGRRILASGHDTTVTERDPSRHAEVNVIRQAARVREDSNLSGAVLFSTCEPCPMCSSLAVWANLTTIVFGVTIEETARLGKSRILVGTDEIVRRSGVMVEVIGGVLADECRSLYI